MRPKTIIGPSSHTKIGLMPLKHPSALKMRGTPMSRSGIYMTDQGMAPRHRFKPVRVYHTLTLAEINKCNIHTSDKLSRWLGAEIDIIDDSDPGPPVVTATAKDPKCRFMWASKETYASARVLTPNQIYICGKFARSAPNNAQHADSNPDVPPSDVGVSRLHLRFWSPERSTRLEIQWLLRTAQDEGTSTWHLDTGLGPEWTAVSVVL